MSYETNSGLLAIQDPLLVTAQHNTEYPNYVTTQSETLSLKTQPSGTVPGKHWAFTFNNKGLLTGVDSALLDTKTLNADWMTGTLTNTGSAASQNIVASSLDATYGNVTPAELNTATGVYTASLAGRYFVHASVSTTTGGGTADYIDRVTILRTSASPASADKIIAWTNQAATTTAAYFDTEYSLCSSTPLDVGDTIYVQVRNQSTASSVTYVAHVSIIWQSDI